MNASTVAKLHNLICANSLLLCCCCWYPTAFTILKAAELGGLEKAAMDCSLGCFTQATHL